MTDTISTVLKHTVFVKVAPTIKDMALLLQTTSIATSNSIQ
jgi:hypothetical protein